MSDPGRWDQISVLCEMAEEETFIEVSAPRLLPRPLVGRGYGRLHYIL